MSRRTSVYSQLLLYLVGLAVLVTTSVAVLHELGHAAFASIHGCRNVSIVLFDTGVAQTYAQMTCPNDPGPLLLFFSSFIFLVPLSGVFFLIDRFKERYLGHIVFGLSIAMAAMDVQLLVQSHGIEFLIAASGAIIALYGADRLVRGIILTETRYIPASGEPQHK